MRVGWLADDNAQIGGAELTQAEFKAAAPDDVEIVDCPPGEVDPDCDRYVIHNVMRYALTDLEPIRGRKVFKYHHDVGPWLTADARAWLYRHTTPICCSPIQADHMGLEAHLIPPPVDMGRFADAAQRVNGDRSGAVSVASWRNHDKAPYRVAEWALANDTSIDFYGGGQMAPPGCQEIPYDRMPDLLARYETFVYLPTVIEPFGRLIAEAWAAGCKIITNRLVGARYWVEEHPEAIDTAADDFWRVVLAP
jgi:hypothetical protein